MSVLQSPSLSTVSWSRRDWLAALLASGMAAAGRAADGPPLRFVVPFPPAGSSDILARAIAPGLGAATGQTVVIDNKPGAGGSIGAAEVARGESDGHTLLMAHVGTLAVNPWLYRKLPYDPLRSFAAVAGVARVPNVLVVPASAPVRTLKDLVALARSRKDPPSYASGGNGSAAHITFEALKARTGMPFLHVPYKGTNPAVTDLLGGQVDATFTGVTVLLPHIQSGRLRPLAVSSGQRLAVLPDVPTVAESGCPGFEADQWYGVVVHSATPPARVQRLGDGIAQALARPEVARQLAAEGAVPLPLGPADFRRLIEAELQRWGAVVKAAGVTLD